MSIPGTGSTMKILIKLVFPPLLSGILLFAPENGHAIDFVKGDPLSQVISARAADCAPSKAITVPLITWGGDIPTVFANGDARSTKPGSIFSELGLSLTLAREDVFPKQVEQYLACRTPFLRGTMGMISMAAEVANRDPRTKPVVIYQMTWSAGGDALVVKGGITRPKDLKGKTIAMQAYGPHVDYLGKVLADAGLSLRDVTVKWAKDLTGTDHTPGSALRNPDIDAALVIIPDALALTSNGTTGTGAEDSVKGAKILLSTKSANRVIADVYVVRSDFLKANRPLVQKFVHGLMKAEEQFAELVKTKNSNQKKYRTAIRESAKLLLDSEHATEDTEAMYADAEFVGWKGNVSFFGDPNYPRGFGKLATEIEGSFQEIGLLSGKPNLSHAKWDFNALKTGLVNTAGVEAPKFDKAVVARVVSRKQQQGTLSQEGLFSFEVFFSPNQNSFDASLYREAFEKVINLASTYGGAIITVEGHSDPLGYLKKKKGGAQPVVLKRISQAAKNLSLTRANAVRDSLVQYATGKGVTLDPSQFAVVGYGISKPRSGICGNDPCPPKSEKEWRDNMRVQFRIIQVEAEESVFKPL